ncbi:Acyl-coenzyme A thioesterase 8, partial [Trichinella nativa]
LHHILQKVCLICFLMWKKLTLIYIVLFFTVKVKFQVVCRCDFQKSTNSICSLLNGDIIYGGQFISHAIIAASQTVNEQLHVHSMQCHFLKQGNASRPVLYLIDRPRQGKSFSVRSVEAVQDGQCIFTAQLSFHEQAAESVEHQSDPPNVSFPDFSENSTDPSVEIVRNGKKQSLPVLGCVSGCFEKRSVILPNQPLDAYKAPLEFLWIKCQQLPSQPDLVFNRCLAAQVTYSLLFSLALKSHRHGENLSVLPVDHSVWFHRCKMDFNAWKLSECSLQSSIGNHHFAHSRIWSREGILLASSYQESVIRKNG